VFGSCLCSHPMGTAFTGQQDLARSSFHLLSAWHVVVYTKPTLPYILSHGRSWRPRAS